METNFRDQVGKIGLSGFVLIHRTGIQKQIRISLHQWVGYQRQ